MSVVATPIAKFLPSGIVPAIGQNMGQWNDAMGGDPLALDAVQPTVVDFEGSGLKAVSFTGGGRLIRDYGQTYAQPMAYAVVLTDWNTGTVFDGRTGTTRHLLYQQSAAPRSSIWASPGYFPSTLHGARDGNPHVVICLFNGDNSFHLIDGERYDGTVGTLQTQGLTLGQHYNGSNQGDATVAAIIPATVALGGETHRPTIAQRLIESFSADLFDVFDGVAAPVVNPADPPVDVARGFPTRNRTVLLMAEDAEAESGVPGTAWRFRNSDNGYVGMGWNANTAQRVPFGDDEGVPALLFDGSNYDLQPASSGNAGQFGTSIGNLEAPCSIHVACRMPSTDVADVTSATTLIRNIFTKIGGSAKFFAFERGGVSETRSRDGDFSNRILFVPEGTLDDRAGEAMVITFRLTEPVGGACEIRGYVDGVDVTPDPAPTATILNGYLYNAMASGGNGGEVSGAFHAAAYYQGDQTDEERQATVAALMTLQGRLSAGEAMAAKRVLLGQL